MNIMTKINTVKEALLQVTFVACIFLIASCDNTQRADDTKEIAEEQNDATFDNNKQEKDAQFLVNAAEISLEEIQLGKLAQQNGRTSHVRELGKMMEDAHTKSLGDLTALAQTKMIAIPTSATEDAQAAYKTLSEKSADDFDEAYADRMVRGHKDAIDKFEKASTDCEDTDIKNWATSSLAGLRMHLDHSIETQKKVDKI